MPSADDSNLGATTIRDPLVGIEVLGYRLKRRIGLGGMGIVYEAEEQNIGRRAAVKVLLPEVAEQPELVERLKSEARAANAVRHRGIIDIFGFASLPDGREAIVMEYLDGDSLEHLLSQLKAEGRLMGLLDALEIVDGVAAVLHAAHTAGVVHRDLKPSNVFLCRTTDGERYVKLLDFGIAKLDMKNGPKTSTNVVLGTPAYMSPEQARQAPAAPSMDLYSLGVLGFEMMTGTVPFDYPTMVEVLLAHQQQLPVKPSTLAPAIPTVVDDFLLRLLEKEPSQRFASGAQVRASVQELRRVLGDPTAATTQPHRTASFRKAIEGLDPTFRATPAATVPTVPLAATPTGFAPVAHGHPSGITTPEPAPRSRRVLVIGLGLAFVALAGGAIAVASRSEPHTIIAALPPDQESHPRLLEDAGSPTVADAGRERGGAQLETASAPDSGNSADPGRPAAGPKPVPDAISPRRAALERRLNALTVKLKARRTSGSPMGLEEQQCNTLRRAMKTARDHARLEAIETAVERLEAELR